MLEGSYFHHIGVACSNFESEQRALAALGYKADGVEFVDPIQGVRIRFLTGQGPRLELIVPEKTGGVLELWLAKGTKLYHLAWETPDIGVALDQLRAARGKVVVPPVPAVAFGGRSVSFVMLPNMLMIELISST
jgi:methylmalonyl-CoA/ethylmalonyl-CoA epimerase